MSETVKIQFYQISKSGYYKYGKDVPEFGSITEILNDLSNWAKISNKALSDTCTYELEDESEDSYRTFCFDIVKNNTTGDFVLVTWNETASNEGRVVTVDGTQTVGNANVEFTDLPEGAIPGYATYFWFIPSHNVFASIRFHHTLLIGKKSLDKYIKEFTAKFSSFIVTEEENDDIEIIGYSNNDGDDVHQLFPDFKSYLFRKPGEITYIRDNIDSIKKIIRKEELNPQVNLDRELWQKILQSLRLSPRDNTLTDEVKIKYEIPFTPTENDIDSIIEEWVENHDSKWDDIGFKFESDAQIRWLSNSVAKDEFNVNVTRNNDEIVDAESLLNSLTELRTVALRLLG